MGRWDRTAFRRAGLAAALGATLLACSGSEGPSAPSGPATMEVLEGAGAAAPAGTVHPGGPIVEVRSGDGAPAANVAVRFQVLEGGGRLAAEEVDTDPQGRAAATWILGRDPGAVQRLRASAGALSVEVTATAVAPDPGVGYLGRSSYVEYLPGTLPLVVTAPHGGYMEPAEIPDRSWGTTARDRNTRELTLAIRDAVFSRTGGYPHVVISNLHRVKLDPNREILEAAQGNPLAERAWWEFQIFAEEAGNLVEDAFGEGLHLDLHGHAHPIDRLELGYLLSSTDLRESDQVLAGTAFLNRSSIRALAEKPGNDLPALLRGPSSLGTLLEDRLIPAVPSAPRPHPGEDAYFTGGYNTVRHGSRDGGSVSAIQIEHHFPGLRDEEGNRARYAQALADALAVFFEAHFGFPLTPGAPPG